METSNQTPIEPLEGESISIPRRGAVAVLGSLVVNALFLAVVDAAGIAPDFMALTYPPVLFLTAVGAVGATAVYWLVRRYAGRPVRTFRVVAAVALVLSFVPDLALLAFDPMATVPGVVVLMAMHVTVAAVAVGVLTR